MEVSSVNNNYDFGSVTSTTNTSSSIKTGTTGASQASSLTTSWTPGNTSTETMDLSFATQEVEQESQSFIDGIGDFFGNIWDGIKNTGAKIAESTTKAVSGLIDTGAKVFTKVTSAVKDGFAWLGEQALATAASVGNIVMSLLEGGAELVEGIGDAFIAVCGGAFSVFTGIYDGINWIGSKITGNEFESLTAAMWTKGIMPIIGYDVSGNIFDSIYSTPFFSKMDELAYSGAKRDGALYKVMKNVGYVSGTILLGVLTGGSSLALTASQATTLLSGAAKAGSEFEKQYNNITENGTKELSGGDVLSILTNGTAKGTIEGALWYLTYGSGLQNVAGKFMGGSAKAQTWLGKTLVTKGSFNSALSKVFNPQIANAINVIFPNTMNRGTGIKMALQFLKPYVNLGVDASTGLAGVDENTSWGDLLKSTTVDAITNAAMTGLYDVSFLKNIMEKASAKEATKFGGKSDYYIEGQNSPIQQSGSEAIAAMNKAAGNTQPQTFKNLIKAISGYDYRGATGSDYQAAHLTRLWFEGLKKSNGNIVKKTLSMPLKGLVDDIVNGFSSVFGLGSNA